MGSSISPHFTADPHKHKQPIKIISSLNVYLLTAPYLLTTVRDIQINPEADYWLDIAQFCGHVNVWQTHHPYRDSLCELCQQHLELANGLYQGDFLTGLSLPDTPEFELWQLAMQEAYHRKALDVLLALGDYYEKTEAYGQAADCAEKAINLEPWMESAHRRRMRAMALSGQRSAAMAHYDRCRYLLAQEMNTAPSARTTQLYEQIRDRKLITEG